MTGELAEHVVDELLRAEGLAAAHAMVGLGLVQRHRLLRLRADGEPRHEPDRILGTGTGAQAALHAVRLDEAQARRVRRIEERGLGARADARLAERAAVLVHRYRAVGRSGGKRYFGFRLRRVLSQVIDGEIERGALFRREVERRWLRHRRRRRERG